jgi:alpha-amylase
LLRLALIALLAIGFATRGLAQAGFDDDRVMLQGFYWESYRFGHPEKFQDYGSVGWYDLVRARAGDIRDGRFDLLWLPPPFFAGKYSAGYNPKEYFNFANSYGDDTQHRALLAALLAHGVEPVADLVFNHRDGTVKWADFKNPDWGPDTICANDEVFFSHDPGALFGLPMAQRGSPEESPPYLAGGGQDYAYPDFRDIDHRNPTVRRDLIKAMLSLRSLGYRGWRYDMVHGFNAHWIAVYNRASQPTFSVGDYDWGAHAIQRGWIWNTATDPAPGGADHLRTSSSVFDFTTYGTLKGNRGNPRALFGYGNGIGMVGDTTDSLPWKQRAVTFLENHDTGYRTNEDGTPQEHHDSDSFANGWEVEQGYAYILTHPGVPCVYWKHYFDWGDDLRGKIKALINARKVAGVKSGSPIHTQNNAQAAGVYAAMIEGVRGRLYVRIGGNDDAWAPDHSGYADFREYAHGAGWKVWVGLPGNPEVQQAPLKQPIPVPVFHKPATFQVTDAQLELGP